MPVSKLIQEPVEDRLQKVDHGKEDFMLCGRPDANLYGNSLLLSEQDRNRKAFHWTTVLGLDRPFSPDLVPQVMLVRDTLQHEEDPSRRYDEVEIASLAVKQGPLFMKLVAAAFTVSGLTEGDLNPIEAVAAGNSEDSAASEQPSPSGASSQQENPPAS